MNLASIRRLAVLTVALLTAGGLLVVPMDRPAPAVAADVTRPVTIMPLGDSITVGVGSATRSGYRADLVERLAAAGLRADFVGSQRSGTGSDTDNEGHVGWTIEQIAANVDVWLAVYQPDVILLHIGTNDTRSAEAAAAAPEKLSRLIEQIGVDRPATEIFVATIVSTTNPARNVLTRAYNAAVPAVVAGSGARVHLVEQSTVGGRDLYNTLHPNDFGYAKMSYNWYHALEPVLGSPGVTWPAGANPYAVTRRYLCNAFECRWWERRLVIRDVGGLPVRARVWQTRRSVTRSYRVRVPGHYRTVVTDGTPVRTWVPPYAATGHRQVSSWSNV